MPGDAVVEFSPDQRRELVYMVSQYRLWVQSEIQATLKAALTIVTPSEITEHLRKLHEVEAHLSANTNSPIRPEEEDLQVVRRSLLYCRKTYAEQHEQVRQKSSHEGIYRQLAARLAPVEDMIAAPWFSQGAVLAPPILSDFLNIQQIYRILEDKLTHPAPDYDEKFGLLLAPSDFLPWLAVSRREPMLRQTTTAVAFIDIDDFKAFNSETTEFQVDQAVLPVFMRRLEAHFFSRGHVFRAGGDEYLVLLPNADREDSASILKRFQVQLEQLRFAGTARTMTVSIGLTTVGPHSPLTDREIQERATIAKKFAKSEGKNRVAWLDGINLAPGAPSVI